MGGYKTRFMMKSQVSQRDAGLDEQPLGVGPVSNNSLQHSNRFSALRAITHSHRAWPGS